MIGKMLVNRYEILEKIGDGGMALVYSAKDHLLNRTVGVKILRSQFADDVQFVERFRREARSAASLSHANIVNIYDVGETDEVHFIVMEFVQGDNLHDLIKQNRRFSQEFIINVGKQIAMGLAHAHYHGIIHRDIKPHNILITPEGRVKVTDFGIAQAMSATNLTQTGMVLGSVHYFSPEQATGTNVQAASDLYSLGIVLYEMITGRRPFYGDSPIAIALKQVQETPTPLKQYVTELDGELEYLVLSLLTKDPKDRPASADEVVRIFQRIERRFDADPERQVHTDHTIPLPVTDVHKEGGRGLAKNRKNSTKRKKSKNKSSKLLIALVVLLVLGGLVFGMIRIIPTILFPEEVQVPNVVGLSEMEAYRIMRSNGLWLKVEQSVFDNEVAAGHVISQDPLPGRMVKQDREILVRMSKGAEEMVMPDVMGLVAREAKLNLTQAGLVLGEEEEVYDPEASPNIVLEQWPRPGTTISKGTAVDLVISKGQKVAVPFTLPDFRGEDFELIEEKLANLGLQLGNSWPEYSTIYSKGQVVEQNPAPGTEVQEGWKIDFVYSQGIAQPTLPPEQMRGEKVEKPKEEESSEWTHEDLWKYLEVTIDIPSGPPQEIVILVIDDFGAREVYRESHFGGSRITRTVQGRGKDARLFVYIGGRQFLEKGFSE